MDALARSIQGGDMTNGDKVRQMTDEELSGWFWWMLHYVGSYTDSRLALEYWLKEEVDGGEK